jgi:hypothetical protein
MGMLWLAVIYAALRHPIKFVQGLFNAGGVAARSDRKKNQNRDAVAAFFGMTREELDELFREMGE